MNQSCLQAVDIRAALSRTLLFAVVALAMTVALATPRPAQAQDLEDADLDAAIESMNESKEDHEEKAIPPSSVEPVNLNVHWRLFGRVVQEGETGTSELESLTGDAFSLGHRNLSTYAAAVYAMALDGHAEGDLSARQVEDMLEMTRQMAPDMPYPDLALSAHLAQNDPARLPNLVSRYLSGLQKGYDWLDTRMSWQLKWTAHALIAVLISMLVFVLGQLLRYFGIISYDLARLLPRGFSSNQTVILIVALIVVPGLLLQSPMVSLLILLATLCLVQRPNERLVTLILFAVLATLPLADESMSEQVTWPQSDTQSLMHAQYLHCRGGCLEDLRERWEEETEGDAVLAYTLALSSYRHGEADDFDQIVELLDPRDRWANETRAAAANLAGTTHLARAEPDAAIEALEEAREFAPQSPAPYFNLMRAHQMNEDGDQAEAALDRAISTDVEAVRAQMKYSARDVNRFLFVEPLPASPFVERHRERVSSRVSIVSPTWETLAGPKVPLEWATPIGIVGILLVLLSIPLRSGGRASSPCPKCGMARDPSDREQTGHHRFCLPCYHTFVSGASLHYDARVHNERVLGRRERIQDLLRRLLTILIPGSGHAQAGHGLGGFALSTAVALAVITVLQPLGIWRPTFELFTDNWGAQVTIAWVVLVLCAFFVLSAAIRGISSPESADKPPSRSSTHD